ncbi:DUF2442 domain-containing protein [Deinococcus sp. QL22]|uniref:DUF2442 domain-containing protein n=1 Tax=Deinococcus sp. QL22 TaxID=2939437 RepID=UPI0020174466|nr:DUF2442 domain-containing protein [Deinococcus sp. QL22]UQN10229.1 DUF2442 domain-containing protein [Deinococcus sp. QL22]
MRSAQQIIEVLPEPGVPQVWVSTGDDQTHRVDLSPLLEIEAFRALQLPRVRQAVRVSPDGQHLRWPGGAQLDLPSITQAPSGALPVRPVAVMSTAQRYRPLLPYLKALDPMIYLPPDPVEPRLVGALLGLNPGELQEVTKHYRAPQDVTLHRLCDLGTFLNDLFARPQVSALLRRAWPYGIRSCPGQPLLHTMLGCLRYGRPDLVERPCLLLATGNV